MATIVLILNYLCEKTIYLLLINSFYQRSPSKIFTILSPIIIPRWKTRDLNQFVRSETIPNITIIDQLISSFNRSTLDLIIDKRIDRGWNEASPSYETEVLAERLCNLKDGSGDSIIQVLPGPTPRRIIGFFQVKTRFIYRSPPPHKIKVSIRYRQIRVRTREQGTVELLYIYEILLFIDNWKNSGKPRWIVRFQWVNSCYLSRQTSERMSLFRFYRNRVEKKGFLSFSFFTIALNCPKTRRSRRFILESTIKEYRYPTSRFSYVSCTNREIMDRSVWTV